MQIKEFYLDLREGPQYGKKTNQGRMLYTEAFKKPLKFTFAFDESELNKLKESTIKLEQLSKDLKKREEKLNELEKKLDEQEKRIDAKIFKINENINTNQEKVDILKVVSQKEKVIMDKINSLMGKGVETYKQLMKKFEEFNHELYIYDKQFFVNGSDIFYGEEMNIPSGNYILIKQIQIIPQNEYAIPEDNLSFEKVYIENSYIPEIEIYGTNKIDNPAAEVRINILFFPVDN